MTMTYHWFNLFIIIIFFIPLMACYCSENKLLPEKMIIQDLRHCTASLYHGYIQLRSLFQGRIQYKDIILPA